MTTLSQAAPWRQLSQWFHDEILEPLFVVLTLIGIVVGIWLEGAGAPDSLTLLVHLATYFLAHFTQYGQLSRRYVTGQLKSIC